MSIHEGHRQRLKARFVQEGLEHFEEAHVLELLLFYAIPRRDTAPVAHALLEQFGSFAGVMEAPLSALTQVPGVGEGAATLLHLTNAIGRYYLIHRTSAQTVLADLESCGEYLLPRFYGTREEMVWALCLDARCKVLACKMLGQGSINATGVPIRRIVEFALSSGATSLVLAHNHPSGIALPSREDVEATSRLAAALDAVGEILADHIIVADEDFISLSQSGIYQRPNSPALPK